MTSESYKLEFEMYSQLVTHYLSQNLKPLYLFFKNHSFYDQKESFPVLRMKSSVWVLINVKLTLGGSATIVYNDISLKLFDSILYVLIQFSSRNKAICLEWSSRRFGEARKLIIGISIKKETNGYLNYLYVNDHYLITKLRINNLVADFVAI